MPAILILFAIVAGGYYVVQQKNKSKAGGEGLTEQMQKSAQVRSGIYNGSLLNKRFLEDEGITIGADGTTSGTTGTTTPTTSTRTTASASGRRFTGIHAKPKSQFHHV